jgi:hypothetical protein
MLHVLQVVCMIVARMSDTEGVTQENNTSVEPSHQFSLVISGSKGDVFICSNWWQWIKNEGPMADGLVRGGRLVRWVRYIGCANGLVIFVDLVVN